jgi:hypothetical protein
MKANDCITEELLHGWKAPADLRYWFKNAFRRSSATPGYQKTLDTMAKFGKPVYAHWLMDKAGPDPEAFLELKTFPSHNRHLFFAGTIRIESYISIVGSIRAGECLLVKEGLRANYSIDVGADLRVGKDIKTNGDLKVGKTIEGGMNIKSGGNIAAGGLIYAGGSIKAVKKLVAGHDITAEWGITAGRHIKSGGRIKSALRSIWSESDIKAIRGIEAAQGIYAGTACKVTCPVKPENLRTGAWVKTPILPMIA